MEKRVAMSEVMKGSSLILPGLGPPVHTLPQQQQQDPHLSSPSTFCSSKLSSSHFQPCRRVRRQHSSHTISSILRHQRQRVLLLDNKLQNGSFFVKHCPFSSFHGDGRALKQQRPLLPKEKFKDTFKLYATREQKRNVDVQTFKRPIDESYGPPARYYSSLVNQVPTALEPPFPSASVDQRKTRDLIAPGNLDHSSSSSSTLEVFQPGSKASSMPAGPTVTILSELRSSRRAEKSTSGQRAPRPNNGRPGPTSDMVGKQPLPRRSSIRNPNSSKHIEAGLKSKSVISNQTVRRSPSADPTVASRASHGSRGTTQGNGRMRMDNSAGTTSESIAVLRNHLQRGITADSYTYVKALQMCLKQKDLLLTKQVHDCVIESGMEEDPYVVSSLINVYIKCGRLLDARRVFDKFEKKTVITWNLMITGYAKSDHHAESALELFKLMRQEGVRPNEVTYLCILNACASPLALTWGKEVHECVRHDGFESDVRVGTAILQMYAKSGSVDDARLMFHRMRKRDLITWTIMIGAYAESGRGEEAYGLFLEMRREGFEPNAFTYMSILNASASAGALEWVKEVHSHASKAGLESDLRLGTALVHMYAKSGSLDDARLMFHRMEKRNVFTWTAMIGAYAESGRGEEAYRLFLEMRREGFEPNAITYTSILNVSASAGALEWVKVVHRHAIKAGLESDLRVASALVHIYAKSGSLDDARLVFHRMKKRDLIVWTIMIGAYAESGRGEEAYGLFLEMRREGFEPNAITYMSILNASASAGALEWVKKVHGHAIKAGLESDLLVASALINMYAKSGSIDDARLVFNRMSKRNTVTWNIMIGGLAQHGCGHEALELFRQMDADLVKPDESTFVGILSACCHAGLLDEGRRLFSVMTQDYGIQRDIVHYNCMVDLLGRAGHLEDAKLFISEMPIEPDGVTWKAFLGACRTYGNVELGEIAANELFKLEPNNAAAYVLLSNIYAAAGKWEKVSWVRTIMQERGVRKEPGRSWIEVDKKIHEFVVGDTSHPEAKAIYTELTELTEKLKAEGYIPDTRLVLHDISEEDKELALCSHSEKLAIAYGLMHVPPGEPIRVEKNLRVCPDCHTATKLISKVTGREIIARDANRFHHFKDGVCSCGDYW